MKARKENKVYDINETSKQTYLDQGFDIYDDNGEIIEYTPLKTIKYNDYRKKIAQKDKTIEYLKAELEKKRELTADNVFDLLKGYADNKNIDVGASTSAKGILEKILEAEKEK